MQRIPVIKPYHLPNKLPVTFSIVLWLLMDRLQTDDVIRGAVYLFLALWWLISIMALINSDFKEPIFKED